MPERVVSNRPDEVPQIREAVSWGKVKPEAKKMTVEGDATISLPIIYAAVMDRL